MKPAIREVLELTRGEAAKHGVSVQTEFVDDLPFIEGDRVELQQVMLNLVLNAIEAMGESSEGPRDLLVSTERGDADGVLVSVQDSGPGLRSSSIAQVFAPFYTTKPGGLGMGLSICHSIIKAHGGRLWASNNAPRGAIFRFSLPQAVADESADAAGFTEEA